MGVFGLDQRRRGDLVRSTVLSTDETGAVNDRMAYTAFGQLVTSNGIGGELPAGFPRYAYAGGFGYESDLLVLDGASGTEPIVLQHVGARWYQPDIGPFIMRDSIGLGGGLNVYAYAANNPVNQVDPNGLADRPPYPDVPTFGEGGPFYPPEAVVGGPGTSTKAKQLATLAVTTSTFGPAGFCLSVAAILFGIDPADLIPDGTDPNDYPVYPGPDHHAPPGTVVLPEGNPQGAPRYP